MLALVIAVIGVYWRRVDDRLAAAAQGADRGRGVLAAVPADLLHLPLLQAGPAR